MTSQNISVLSGVAAASDPIKTLESYKDNGKKNEKLIPILINKYNISSVFYKI